MMKKAFAIHPFILALWPALFVFAQNQEHLKLAQLWLPLSFLLGFTALAFLLFTLILKDGRRSGILLSLFLFLFFSFGQVMQLAAVPFKVLVIAWIVIFVAGSAIAVLIKRGLDEITKILNVVASVFVAISLLNIAVNEYNWQRTQQAEIEFEPVEIIVDEPRQLDTLPDIYCIILDGYARADILEELFDHDNSYFLESLREKGFYVADSSWSNYAQTTLSLASLLNIDYLDQVASQIGPETGDRGPLGDLIENSAVIKFLKQNGYQIVSFPTGYSPTTLDDTDMQLQSEWAPNEVQVGLLLATPIPWLLIDSEFNPQIPHGNRIMDALDHLADTAEVQSPHFVFVHILIPHPPFIFDADGTRLDSERPLTSNDGSHFFEGGGTKDEYLTGYVAQLTFVNGKIGAIVDDLLSRSSRPTVIILQADHGSGLLLDWDDPENTYLKERFSILNAYLLPDGASGDLYERITPVNTFRVIFNRYFGTDLELLEDRSYFSTWQRPYDFIDVTDSLQ
jgi:hypothetical protein